MTHTMNLVATAYRAYLNAGSPGDADRFIQDRVKGARVQIRPGVVITVSSVSNAGFNGYQVGGYTDANGYAIGFYR
jgi:hypothetical protein